MVILEYCILYSEPENGSSKLLMKMDSLEVNSVDPL